MNRPDRLVIEHRPRSLMLMLAALAGVALAVGVDLAWHGSLWAAGPLALALVLALLVHYDFPAHTTVTLDQTTGMADILWHDDAGLSRRTLPLHWVERAVVDTIRSHDGPAIRRTALVVGDRHHQLTRAFLSGPTPDRVARAINDWLAR